MKLFETAQAAVNPTLYDPSRTGFLSDKYSQTSGSMNSAQIIVDYAINTILLIAGALAIIYFIYSGILYITAAGNPDGVKKGQTGLIYGAVGIALVTIGYFILTAVAKTAVVK